DVLSAINREIGKYKSQNRDLSELPDVYIIDKAGKLVLIKQLKEKSNLSFKYVFVLNTPSSDW
ncbi:MAG: hypothetical protein RR220_10070, partial [Bacteroidaceae bacterium]